MINFKDDMEQVPLTVTNDEFNVVLNVSALGLTNDQFFRLCRDNETLNFEMSAAGELIIMSPTKLRTGQKNAIIIQRLSNWAERDGTGKVFDSNSIFILPNGANRVPDAAWLLKSRWDQLTEEDQDNSPLCPDFVIELRSRSDRMNTLKAKMEEYRANGVRLGWLLDPIGNCALIYRPGAAVIELQTPEIISGDPVLPGFRFNFREIL